jgi:uncharacterized membrane protein
VKTPPDPLRTIAAMASPDHVELNSGNGAAAEKDTLGEPRWPPAVALLVFMALTIALRLWLPTASVIRVPWLVPAAEAVLLLLLLVGQPARLRARREWARPAVVVVVVVLVLAALWSTGLLVDDLIRGSKVTQSPTELLASGGLTWLGNNLAFGLLYWLMDGGGPVARLSLSTPADFAFTQQLSPEIAPPGWRPVFLDYLHLGFTNATAFSPTDVMPLTHRAKYAMLVHSTVALALFGLIVARAVNAFT